MNFFPNDFFLVFVTDGQVDRQTDRQMGGQTGGQQARPESPPCMSTGGLNELILDILLHNCVDTQSFKNLNDTFSKNCP